MVRHMLHSADRSPRAGFTLVELLAVAAISSFLLAGLAAALHLFGQEVETIKADADTGPEEALALMTDMARHGWIVEHPADGKLEVIDAAGGKTSFTLLDHALLVTRPSGATGELLTGVAKLDIETDAMRRLREDAPIDAWRTWFDKPEAATPGTIALEGGLPVALGFMLPSPVPAEFDVVEGVSENTVYASLEKLVMSLSYVGTVPADPNPPINGATGGKKVEICHVPPGNPDNAHTLSVSTSALDAHLDHGDLLGSCEAAPDKQNYPDLTIELFEARAPDDARPVGPVLGSLKLMAVALPSGYASWAYTGVGKSTHSTHDHPTGQCNATTASGKVVICHVPPGKPGNAHSITIAPSAVAAHLAHGDYFGCCGAHEQTPGVYTLNLNSKPQPFTFDLSKMGALIEPGRAYTLVLSMAGPGVLHVAASPTGAASNSGVAQATLAYGMLEPLAVSVPFQLQGMQRITQTEEFEPVSRVSLTLEMQDGQSVSGSAGITSQTSVPGLWMGAVPGQQAELDP
jgi:prepilin-type N-terminal cleavage/methylation domain-containing protein